MGLFGALLPRHLQIIYEINHRFLDAGARRRFPGDDDAPAAHVDHRGGRREARPHGHLAIVGSHTVNGVAALHTRPPQERAVPRLLRAVAREVQQQDQRHHPAPLAAQVQPGPVARSSPSAIGDGWVTDLDQLEKLEPLADDPAFRADVAARSSARTSDAWPRSSAAVQRARHRARRRPDSLFDVPGQAHPRVQAPAAQRPARHHALQPDQGQTADGDCVAAHRHLRRQGGARATTWPSSSSG